VRVSGCAGINEFTGGSNSLSVYPNPSNGEFTMQASDEIIITLVNDLGQLIRVIELSSANNNKVTITDVPQGIYFISGEKDNTRFNQKIVVTR